MAKRKKSLKEKLDIRLLRAKIADIGMREKLETIQAAMHSFDGLLGSAAAIGAAWAGYNKWKEGGALFGLVSYKLATSPSLPAATAGVIGLAGLGLASVGGDLALEEALNTLTESSNKLKEFQEGLLEDLAGEKGVEAAKQARSAMHQYCLVQPEPFKTICLWMYPS